jgi:hypothetical protein
MRQRQEDCAYKATLIYMRPISKTKTKTKKYKFLSLSLEEARLNR